MRKTKVKDFGEKLHGARKDIWRATPSLTDLTALTDDELIRVVAKKRLWNTSDFKNLPLLGVDPDSHYRLSSLRRAIHPKPVRLPDWTVRETCILYFETLLFVKTWAATLRRFENFDDHAERLISGYCLVPPLVEEDREDSEPKKPDLRLCPLQGKFVDWEKQMETVLGSRFLSLLKLRAVPTARGVRRAARSIDEILLALTDEYHFDADAFLQAARIIRLGEKKVLEGCRSPGEFRLTEAASLGLQSLTRTERDMLKRRLRFGFRQHPAKLHWKPDDPVREGLPERFDCDILPETVAQSLHVRGGEFGNWVPGSERSKKLRLLAESFHDLADLLGFSIDEVSLGGGLGLALGSRGRGGRDAAIAHFEPWSNVISLTRQKSDGSICHEWAHALDLVLGRLHTANQPKTGRFLRYPFLSQEIFSQVRAHIADRKAWKDGPTEIRSLKNSPLPQEVIQPIAMFASEFYAHYLLVPEAEKMEHDVSQLHAGYVKDVENLLRELLVIPFTAGRIEAFDPADAAALDRISAACRQIREAVADRHTSVDALSAAVREVVGQPLGSQMRQRLLSSMELLQQIRFQTQALRDGKGDWRVPSDWRHSLRRETPYWRKPEELFARAIEAFVFDRMAARQACNTFLLSPQCGDAMWSGYYPSGIERDRFNSHLTDFFNALKKHGVLANLGAEAPPGTDSGLPPGQRHSSRKSEKQRDVT